MNQFCQKNKLSLKMIFNELPLNKYYAKNLCMRSRLDLNQTEVYDALNEFIKTNEKRKKLFADVYI